ncbi:MAG: phosphoenolpyruvate carboxykinase (GTP) [Candidatus Lokiarchaeota archaeon]|nr:phosphoenolpyruvate carboxykinase (GTP) [Candidatus Lokiarchaeota archaeon]MCK4381662.1 phosphoenolpyruvate carboxykinase (GTP) [Candidatus Lokiarchaeota archaeon]
MELTDPVNIEKLDALYNEHILKVVNNFISLCKPAKVTVITDSKEDIEYCRQKAIEIGEEAKLETEGHSVHYDGFFSMSNHDQARDKENTRVLISEGDYASPWINTIDREKGLKEILEIMDGCMKDRECLVRFFCLGPKNSKFSILALQLTDSFYVAHSEDLLYRSGYEEFKKLDGSDNFFYFIHSGGELTGNPPVTKDLSKRRIYIDLQERRVLSCYNQYAGNSLGLKKLALRLAIDKSNSEDWLAEHYFILGIHPKGKNRTTFACGAYPSGCGKTSTAMLPGQTIVGDDIAYMRKWEDGYAHAVNIERGIFGIIKDVNSENDPVIYEAITTPRETIFSNVLIKDKNPYWIGDGNKIPDHGVNFSGEWYKGKEDKNGKKIPHAHPNGRYTIRIEELANADPNLHNPNGVPISAIFYGGRDSDTMPPVVESLDWEHGVFLGASIESETTAQTLGAEGVRKSQPMANLDFIVVPLAKYFENHKKFGDSLTHSPKVFAVNYFLKNEDGKYLNGILDKLCWVMWAEGRTKDEFHAIHTPIGYIPYYKDLKTLFKQYLDKDYNEKDYIEQFTIRIGRLLEKLERIEANYKKETNIPKFFWRTLSQQRSDLMKLKKMFNGEEVSPFKIAKKN